MKASGARARKRWRWGVPHVDHQVDRHGHARWWYRQGKGPRLAVLPMPGTPTFLSAWEAAHAAAEAGEKLTVLAGRDRLRPGSLAAALAAYYTSTAWTGDLGASSRDMRRPILEKLKANYGDAPMGQLRRDHIQSWIKPLKPNAQKNWMKAISGLIKFALKTDLIAGSPLLGVIKDKAERTDGHIAWTEDDVDRFRARFPLGSRERLALEIMLNLGVRRGDACRIGPSDIKGGWLIDFVPEKTTRTTGVKISVPLHDDLKAAITAMKTVSTKTFIVTAKGRPFKTGEAFGAWMREAFDAAGLPEISSHGLRKLAAIRLAFSGASVIELMKIFGWRSPSQAQVYVDQADRMRMAGQAMARLQAYQNASKISPTL